MTISIQEFIIPAGFLGYVGRSQLDWSVGAAPARNDWDGPHIAPDADQATGYVKPDIQTQRGHGSLWRASTSLPIKAVLVKGDPKTCPRSTSRCAAGSAVPGTSSRSSAARIAPMSAQRPRAHSSWRCRGRCSTGSTSPGERVADARFKGMDHPDWGLNLPDAPWLVLANIV